MGSGQAKVDELKQFTKIGLDEFIDKPKAIKFACLRTLGFTAKTFVTKSVKVIFGFTLTFIEYVGAGFPIFLAGRCGAKSVNKGRFRVLSGRPQHVVVTD
jgi:hypothetical protein